MQNNSPPLRTVCSILVLLYFRKLSPPPHASYQKKVLLPTFFALLPTKSFSPPLNDAIFAASLHHFVSNCLHTHRLNVFWLLRNPFKNLIVIANKNRTLMWSEFEKKKNQFNSCVCTIFFFFFKVVQKQLVYVIFPIEQIQVLILSFCEIFW